MLNFCDFIQVSVFTTNHHLKQPTSCVPLGDPLDRFDCTKNM